MRGPRGILGRSFSATFSAASPSYLLGFSAASYSGPDHFLAKYVNPQYFKG